MASNPPPEPTGVDRFVQFRAALSLAWSGAEFFPQNKSGLWIGGVLTTLAATLVSLLASSPGPVEPSAWQRVWPGLLTLAIGAAATLFVTFAWALLRAPYRLWEKEENARKAAETARNKAVHDLEFHQGLRSIDLGELSRMHAAVNAAEEEKKMLRAAIEDLERRASERADSVGRLRAMTFQGRNGVTVDAAEALSELAEKLAVGLDRFWIADLMKRRLGVPSADSVAESLIEAWALEGLIAASDKGDQLHPPYILTEAGRSIVREIRANF